MSIRKSIVALCLILPAVSVFAAGQGGIEKSVQLKDGTTVHQFKDGKMAMEDKYGRPFRMNDGAVMISVDGQTLTMKGDEVARLSNLQQQNRGGNN